MKRCVPLLILVVASSFAVQGCASVRRVVAKNEAQVNRVKVTYRFYNRKQEQYDDTTVIIDSESEIDTLMRLAGKKQDVKLCQGYGTIEFCRDSEVLFAFGFGLACDYCRLLGNGWVSYARRDLNPEARAILQRYKAPIMRDLDSCWMEI